MHPLPDNKLMITDRDIRVNAIYKALEAKAKPQFAKTGVTIIWKGKPGINLYVQIKKR